MIRLSLRRRIVLILTGFVLITIGGALTLVWYTFRMEELLVAIIEKDLKALQDAEALESALIHQKGFVSYYLIDGNPDWLIQLENHRREFTDQLARIEALADKEFERETLRELKAEFERYVDQKDRVIEVLKTGPRAAAIELQIESYQRLDRLLSLSARFKEIHAERMREARNSSHERALKVRWIAMAALVAATALTLMLGFVFIFQILDPLRRLAAQAGPAAPASENEIKALSRSVHDLLLDVGKTQSELERSRESLVQSEKMALVGKLAAGMAHSLRNPFTSVKMRLFSLGRSLELDEAQKDDFAVISAEIRHIDAIVQNFLEFSRPPKLAFQPVSPSTTVDAALQLLEHRLKSYDVEVRVDRARPLPPVSADPEQLKEVLANVIVNACEAMGRGGRVVITERVEAGPDMRTAAVVSIRDTGPGVPAALLDSVFQPFFTTKEEGTGLGLSIAQRIILDHGGRITAAPADGPGAVFTLTLPVPETTDENDPHR